MKTKADITERERERERANQITKTKDCSASDCVNRHIEKGVSGLVCVNCQEELKRFVARLNKIVKK